MANIRRPGSLTSVLGDVKNKIEILEARNSTTAVVSPFAISGESDSDLPPADGDDTCAAPSVTGNSAPYTYKRIIKAYFYGSKVTGNTPRMEFYFNENPEIEQGQCIQFQGINGNSTDTWEELSPGVHGVYAIDSSPWTDGPRATQDWRDTPTTGGNGQNVNYTVWFNPQIEAPTSYSTEEGREFITTRKIDSVTAANTTVTVNFNSNHIYRVGDVISVDLAPPLYGVDGLFKVSNVVDNNTIQYELSTALTTPISLSGGTLGNKYAYPVAHRYVLDGTIWNDTSFTPSKVMIWKEYRWYDSADPAVAAAGLADTVSPSPVSNLIATSSTQEVATVGESGKAQIKLTWEAPTTNADGTALSDLGGYSVWWRYSNLDSWRINEIDDPTITEWIEQNFIYNVPVYLAVYAKDKFGNRSTAATTSLTTAATPAPELLAPSAPSITGYLGTMKVFWNGLDSAGNAAHISASEVELHISTTSGFTASSSTLYERFPAINGPTYTVIPGNAIIAGSEIIDGQTYYFKFKFIDVWGNRTGESAQGSFVGQKSDIVTFDMIDVGTVDGEVLIGAEIRTKVNPADTTGNGGGVVLDSTGFTAYNGAGVQSFNINFANGNVSIPGAGSITIANYATSDRANSIEQIAISANGIAISAGITANNASNTANTANQTASQTNTTVSAFTTIQAGVVKISKTNVVSSINEGISTSTTTIDGGSITTDSIDANRIKSDTVYTGLLRTGAAGTNRIEIRGSDQANPGIVHLDGSGGSNFRFYANGSSYLNNLTLDNASLSGTLSVTGTISGGTIRTSGGARVQLDGGTNTLKFFSSATTEVSSISGAANFIFNTQGFNYAFQVSSSTVFSITASGISLAPGGTFNSNLDVNGRVFATGTVQSGSGAVVLGTTGNIINSGNVTSDGFLSSGGVVQVSTMNISTTNPVVRWLAGSRVALTVTSSDARIKANVEPIQNALAIINQLNPITFDSLVDQSDKRAPGFIAQEVEQVFSGDVQIVSELDSASIETDIDISEGPLKTLNYESFVPYLVKAVQELAQRNTELQTRIDTLEER